VIIQQVDFVNIQQSTIGSRQHTRFKSTHTFLDGFFDVQRPHHAVFCGGNRQVYEGCGAGDGFQLFTGMRAFTAFCAPRPGFFRVAAKAAFIHNLYVGQQGCQGARGC